MFRILLNSFINHVHIRNITTTRYNCKTHYDVLKLSKNCTRSEIRNSFLKLSKKHHPDRTINNNSHTKYVEILEAYKVLIKPSTRYMYDLGLATPRHDINNAKYADRGVWTDNLWQFRDKTQDKYYESKPYYGINGLKKISNTWIVFLCLSIASIGISVQILAIRHSFTMKRDEMEKRSSELEQLHSNIRLQALTNGDRKQIELLKEKFRCNETK